MHKRLLETIGVALLLGGCTESPAIGSDAAIAPEDRAAKPIDSDVLVAEDVVADVVTPFDRVDAGDVVDAPTADADVAPAVADVGVDVGGPRCPAGQSLCGDACVDLTSDAMHCGACATACPSGRVCAAGACSGEQRSCPATGGRGCGLVEITGGTFAMGDATLPDYVYASPVQPMITVSDFAVDAYEVTVARFRRFWDAGHPNILAGVPYPGAYVWPVTETDVVTEPVALRGSNECTWTREVGSAELLPLNCLTLATAQSFCVWDGGRLPTEAEWEYLAKARPIAGLPAPRRFPWGNNEDGVGCVVGQFGILCPGDLGYPFRAAGSYPAIGGLYDLAGNVAEMTASAFWEYWQPSVWGGVPRVDPFARALTCCGGEFIYRGGMFLENDLSRMNSSARARFPGYDPSGQIGFRCVRNRP